MQTPKLADPIALIRAGSLPEKVIPVCLDARLVCEYEDAEAELLREADRAADSLAGGRAAELRQQLADLKERMQESTVEFRFRALPSPRYKGLKGQYPPRRDGDEINDRDALLGVNEDGFFVPLLKACLVYPELDHDTFTVLVEERLSDGQLNHLTTEVFRLNQGRVNLPF